MARSYVRRLLVNWWWAFVLVLGVLLASVATFPVRSSADGSDPIAIPGGGSGPGSPPSGDPDSPSNGKRSPGYGRAVPVIGRSSVNSTGDGISAKSVWVWRLHVVLQSLIVRYSR